MEEYESERLLYFLIASEMSQRFDSNSDMEIVYAYGFEAKRSIQMQSVDSFRNYVSVVETQKIQFDVVINDGHVKPQVAYAISSFRSIY